MIQDEHPRGHEQESERSGDLGIPDPVADPAEKELSETAGHADDADGRGGLDFVHTVVDRVRDLVNEGHHHRHDGQYIAECQQPEPVIAQNGPDRCFCPGSFRRRRVWNGAGRRVAVGQQTVSFGSEFSHKQLGNHDTDEKGHQTDAQKTVSPAGGLHEVSGQRCHDHGPTPMPMDDIPMASPLFRENHLPTVAPQATMPLPAAPMPHSTP